MSKDTVAMEGINPTVVIGSVMLACGLALILNR
jgi:hypothetical protein